MGYQDRDYYREPASPWFGNPGGSPGTIGLIVLLVLFFFVQMIAPREGSPPVDPDAEELIDYPPDRSIVTEFGDFHPNSLFQGQVWRVFTAPFLYEPYALWGLAFSLICLYFVGGELEVMYGTRRFLTFFVLACLAAGLVKIVLAACGLGRDVHTQGPAAGLFAVFVLYAFHFPFRTIRIFWFIPVPVWLAVSLYLLGSLTMLLMGMQTRRGQLDSWQVRTIVTALEPLVGAVIGFFYYRTRGELFGFMESAFDAVGQRGSRKRSPANLRVFDPKTPRAKVAAEVERPARAEQAGSAPTPAAAGVDEYLEAKLDAVLEKVAKHGKTSLTPEENDILLKASEIFKRRRR